MLRYALIVLVAFTSLTVVMMPCFPEEATRRPPKLQDLLGKPSSVKIPMSDGEELAADIYLPAAEGKFPAILVITPYGKFRMGSICAPVNSREYAVVMVDRRGFYASRGAKTNRRAKDGYSCVEWIAVQSWSNGRVGMWGGSALGHVQFETAVTRPPHLVCIVPSVAPFGYDYENNFLGGVFRREYYDSLLKLGFKGFEYILDHPLRDAFWNILAGGLKASDVAVPVLIIEGWYDLYPTGVFKSWRKLVDESDPSVRDCHRMLIGPWVHSGVDEASAGALSFTAAEGAAAAATKAFFDHHLLGGAKTPSPLPRVRLYDCGSLRWEDQPEWPIKATKEQMLFFGPDRSLSSAAAETGTVEFTHDPTSPVPTVGGGVLDYSMLRGPQDLRQKVESREDVVIFTTESVVQPMHMAGSIFAEIVLEVEGEDADIILRLTDVMPDGRSIIISEGARRVGITDDFRALRPLKPGEPYKLKIEMFPLLQTVEIGHRIRLVVSGSNSPRFEVRKNPAKVRIHCGGESGSSLRLTLRESTKPAPKQ
ncbi:MAG: CocE/NonD family hydrolase [Candidatus Brocadiia bacterium]